MRKGVSGYRRVAAILSVSMVAVIAAGSMASASAADLTTYSAVGTGQVLRLKLQLPKAVTTAVNQVLGAVSGPLGGISLPDTIDESIAFSRSIGNFAGSKVSGSSVGRMFYGTLDKTVLEPAVTTLFPDRVGKGLPLAEAVLGGVEHATDGLVKNLKIPSETLSLINLGLMNVSADSTPVSNTKAALSSAESHLANVVVDLAPEIKAMLKEIASPLTELTDNTLIPTLNGLLGTVTDTLKDTLDLDVNLQLPKIADLLDKPLLKIGKIETSSATDALGRVRNAKAMSRISDINIFGNSAADALVHISVLESNVEAAIDGTVAGAKAVAKQTILGLSVLDNEIAIFNDHIKVLNKTIPVSLEDVANVLNQVTGLVTDTLGLKITAFKTDTEKSAFYSRASSQTLAISFHPQIAGLGELVGLDIEAPSAIAEVAGDRVLGFNPKPPLPTTGVPTTMYFVLGSALLGATVLVRRFALSR